MSNPNRTARRKYLPFYRRVIVSSIFFFNSPATAKIYTLSLHDALPIFHIEINHGVNLLLLLGDGGEVTSKDRKSTRLNSSHGSSSYAVFCLKKKTAVVVLGAGAISSPGPLQRERVERIAMLRIERQRVL